MALKRVELKRTAALSRTEMNPSTKPINKVSNRRQRVNRIRRRNLEAAWGPHPWICEGQRIGSRFSFPHICFGEVNGHELLKRTRSGRDENLTNPEGIVPICDWLNGYIEDHPNWAEDVGLSLPSGPFGKFWDGAKSMKEVL